MRIRTFEVSEMDSVSASTLVVQTNKSKDVDESDGLQRINASNFALLLFSP